VPSRSQFEHDVERVESQFTIERPAPTVTLRVGTDTATLIDLGLAMLQQSLEDGEGNVVGVSVHPKVVALRQGLANVLQAANHADRATKAKEVRHAV
jgi:hypothetical protein